MTNANTPDTDLQSSALLVLEVSHRRAAGYLTSPVLEARAAATLRLLMDAALTDIFDAHGIDAVAAHINLN